MILHGERRVGNGNVRIDLNWAILITAARLSFYNQQLVMLLWLHMYPEVNGIEPGRRQSEIRQAGQEERLDNFEAENREAGDVENKSQERELPDWCLMS